MKHVVADVERRRGTNASIETIEIKSDQDLLHLLATVDGREVSMVSLRRGDATLVIAGGPERFVVAWDEAGMPPYHTLCTDDPLDEPVYLTTGGQLSDYPAEVAVLGEEARAAIAEFARTGNRTSALSWREE